MELKQFYNIDTKVSSRKKCYYYRGSAWLYSMRKMSLCFVVLWLDCQPLVDLSGVLTGVYSLALVYLYNCHGNNDVNLKDMRKIYRYQALTKHK